ncbi:uncharacterized protein LOC110466025 isoform X2 [Mizuhopecten yessoensis]|uniref:Uncharacterized protein n=1 Tax=Mizuhopecten yessoensis TaxID=6573 RepID=A0A210R237_MIZYE|nr:uncharacterized protein LOC110466025 isoform X2 [Mizuhopecten yessoensis]OWF54971.1 hypothetical protein KP79_PYT17947 [Mizuhopecten yessoensis]
MEDIASKYGLSCAESKSEEAPVLEVICNQGNGDVDPNYVPYWMRSLTPDMSYLLSDNKYPSRTSTRPDCSLFHEFDSSSDNDEEIWTESSPILKEEGADTEILELRIVKEDEETHTKTVTPTKDDNMIVIPPVWRFIQGTLIVLIIALVSFLLIRFIKRPWEDSVPVTHHEIHAT